MISKENSGKVSEGKFSCAFCRKGVSSNSILCQFRKCWVHKDVVVFDVNWKIASLTVRNQQTGIAEDCLSIELNDQFLEIVE